MTSDVDVVVIGAGIAGIAVAAELSSRFSVVLLEQESLPAQHASGRSASVLSETSGHPAVCALARMSRPFFEQPPAGFAEHPLVTPRGLLWVGEVGEEQLLDDFTREVAEHSPSSRRLDADETRRLLPGWSERILAAGSVYEPDAMSIDTAAVISGYLRQFSANGGILAAGAGAVDLHSGSQDPPRDRRWDVVTTEATWRTDHVVNAAGAWVDIVAERAGLRAIGCTPMRRTAAITPAPDHVRSWPLVMDVSGRFYCEPETGGLLISPADETPVAPCDAQAEELDVALALERVRDATGLELRSIRRAWAGLRTFTPDRVPVLGEDPAGPGFWWLAGQGGAGIKTAPALATLLANLIAGEAWPTEAESIGLSSSELSPARFT